MSKGDKYELIKEPGSDLYRIKALRAIPNRAKKGQIGGLVSGPQNLAQDGDCWVEIGAQVIGGALVTSNALVTNYAKVSGDAWVSGNARIRDSAHVFGNARVYDNATILGSSMVSKFARVYGDVMVIDSIIRGNAKVEGPKFGALMTSALLEKQSDLLIIRDVGSERGTLLIYRTESGVEAVRGCFRGSLEEFAAAVRTTHGTDSQYAKEYMAIIELAKVRMEVSRG